MIDIGICGTYPGESKHALHKVALHRHGSREGRLLSPLAQFAYGLSYRHCTVASVDFVDQHLRRNHPVPRKLLQRSALPTMYPVFEALELEMGSMLCAVTNTFAETLSKCKPEGFIDTEYRSRD